MNITTASFTQISQLGDYVAPTDFSGSIGYTGMTGAGALTARYTKVGKLINVEIGIFNATGSLTTRTITGLPYAIASSIAGNGITLGNGKDNGVVGSLPIYATMSGTTLTVYKDITTAVVWTAAGSCSIQLWFSYPTD